jgi:hypothetical protein
VQCFGGYTVTICADQMHVLEYLGDAAKVLWPRADQEAEREKSLFGESRASVSTRPDASEPADRGRGTWRRRPASGWGWRS